jgi:hypothetical protein
MDQNESEKRSFDPLIFFILNQNETPCSTFFGMEKDRTNLVRTFLEQRKNKPAYSKIFKIKEDKRG